MKEQEQSYTVKTPDGVTDFFYADTMWQAYEEALETYGEGVTIRPSWYGEWKCGSEEIARKNGSGCWHDNWGNHYVMKEGELVNG
jgi:hypothetical protein